MKLTQLDDPTDLGQMAQEVNELVVRYDQLMNNPDALSESDTMHDVIHELKTEMLRNSYTTYDQIDQIMRSLSDTHKVNVHDLHDAFVAHVGQTPDAWIHAQLSAQPDQNHL